MPKIYLLTTESDPVANAVDKLLAGTTGYRRLMPGEVEHFRVESGDVFIAGDSTFDSEPDIEFSEGMMIQFLGCNPSQDVVGRFLESDSTVAGISPVIAPRVANRAAGFGGPLRVKPGSKWGLVGLGEVGSEVARKLIALGSTVEIADQRTPRSGLLAELNVRRLSLDLLIAGSDAVSLHLHAGPTAAPLIEERELNLMKSGAVLINTSHSSIVDEDAVIRSLEDGPLGGYATDRPGEVILGADESLTSSGQLFVTTNLLTNQIGAAQQIAKYVAANIEAFADGGGVQGLIEPVDFPKIGDPSFWASRMSPRQD